MLDAEREFVEQHYSNVHRGVHTLSQEATDAYEAARGTVARFLGATDPHEVVFTKNATEAYNLVAYSFGNAKAGSRFALGPGDEVCVTEMEHHSNLVPWQMLCERTGATLRWFPLTDDGRLDLTDLDELVNERTKVLAFVHVSNILGTENPVDVLVARAREVGAFTLLDGAQSAPHQAVDVQALGVDFFVATGHKMLAPVRRRRAVGPQGAARRDAAVPRRRLDDRGRADGVVDVRAGARALRGRHAGHQPGRRAGRCLRLPHRPRPGPRRRRTSARSPPGCSTACATWTACASSARTPPSCAAPPSPSPSTACTRTTSASRSTSSASPSASGTTAPRRSAAATACRRPRGRRRTSTTPRPRSTRCWKAWCPVQRFWSAMTESLYQEIILDHYRNPHHKGLRDPYDVEVHHVNPTCGDEVTLRVKVDGGLVQDVSYDGQGCSISQASTSVMTDLVIGKPVDAGAADVRGVPRADAEPRRSSSRTRTCSRTASPSRASAATRRA